MRALARLLPLLVFIGLAGCNKIEIGGKPAPFMARHAVSLSPSATEIVYRWMTPLNLEGRTSSCNYPPNMTNIQVVMNGIKPDYETIAKLKGTKKVDLIVYDASLFHDQDIEKFKELGLRTFGFKATTLQSFYEEIYDLASIAGAETTATEYVDKIVQSLSLAKANMPKPAPKVAYLLPGNGSEHMICGTDSFLADVTKQMGAECVGPKGALFMPLSAEQFIAMDPDVLIVSDDEKPVLNDARFAQMKAIRNHRCYRAVGDVLLRKGSRVNILIDSLKNALSGAR